MKSLVIYYSMEGHTRLIAELIAKESGADIFELKTQKDKSKTGFSKYIWGGKSVLFNEKPKLVSLPPDLDTYEWIYIGTPIWASSYTPPVNTLLTECKITGKKLMLFACHAGGGADKCFRKMKERLSGNDIVGMIDFNNPTEENEADITRQIRAWLSSMDK